MNKDQITSLPKTMQERALKARKLFIDNPSESQFDDNMLVWCYDDEDELWYSILGNYSQYSPHEKRLKQAAYDDRYSEMQKATEDQILEEKRLWFYHNEVRGMVLDRDDYTCQICGLIGDSSLHIHHILKRKDGGSNFADNLITVCPKCHKSADSKLYNPDWHE